MQWCSVGLKIFKSFNFSPPHFDVKLNTICFELVTLKLLHLLHCQRFYHCCLLMPLFYGCLIAVAAKNDFQPFQEVVVVAKESYLTLWDFPRLVFQFRKLIISTKICNENSQQIEPESLLKADICVGEKPMSVQCLRGHKLKSDVKDKHAETLLAPILHVITVVKEANSWMPMDSALQSWSRTT